MNIKTKMVKIGDLQEFDRIIWFDEDKVNIGFVSSTERTLLHDHLQIKIQKFWLDNRYNWGKIYKVKLSRNKTTFSNEDLNKKVHKIVGRNIK